MAEATILISGIAIGISIATLVITFVNRKSLEEDA